ncbi:hypothetical protein [Nocardia mikamii]|uniref:hypothetical protein n=1 Tax=Nocardia mikamii TaxID=508464 RepID=UPI0007A3EA06|nr:hypothetical protein [Nocardia mikamii]
MSVRQLMSAVTGLIVVGAVWWILWVTLLGPNEKSTASGYGQFVVAVVVAVCSLVVWVVRTFWSRTAEPLDRLADRLAARMHERWAEEAHDRDLVVEPLPIRWRQAALSVAVPVAAATSTRGGRPRFDPLPGVSVITSAALQEGDRSTLYDVYGGLPSGRLVITGDAGSGKSAAAILLLLDALKFREQGHSGIPVPVMFTLHNWDPEGTPFNEWLIDKLAETLPLRRREAKSLVQARRIAVFLDGLDEMPEQLRPIALQALNKADFRLVLLSRREEFRAAVQHEPLLGAAVIELRSLKPADAADYLLRHVVSPPPPNWQAVAEKLNADPRSPLARALNRPLTVTLLRDTYPQSGEVDELLDRKRFPTPKRIESHLLDQVLIAAYTPEAGGPKPRYSVQTAERTLGYIADRLKRNGSRDLAWWTIGQWTEPGIALFARAMTVWFVTAIPIGFLLGLSYWIADGREIASGVPVGLAIGLVSALSTIREKTKPKRVAVRWWLAPVTTTGLLMALPLGLGTGFALVFVNDLEPALVWWLVLGVVLWLTLGIGTSLFVSDQDDNRSHDPVTSWRQDVMAGLGFGVICGFGALTAGLCFGMRFDLGLPAVLAVGLLGGLAAMLALPPAMTASWPTFCFQIELALRHRTPVRLMRFLEDARQRGVLRTVGPIYQFRHAELQDRLAANVSKPQ